MVVVEFQCSSIIGVFSSSPRRELRGICGQRRADEKLFWRHENKSPALCPYFFLFIPPISPSSSFAEICFGDTSTKAQPPYFFRSPIKALLLMTGEQKSNPSRFPLLSPQQSPFFFANKKKHQSPSTEKTVLVTQEQKSKLETSIFLILENLF